MIWRTMPRARRRSRRCGRRFRVWVNFTRSSRRDDSGLQRVVASLACCPLTLPSPTSTGERETALGIRYGWMKTALCERGAAIFKAGRYFSDRVGAFGDGVFELDVGVDRPLLLFQELEDFLDRGLAFAPRQVSSLRGAVLEVEADDALVILLDHGDGGLAFGAREVVADVEVEADVLAELEDGVGAVDDGDIVRVVVEGDPDPVLVGEGGEAAREVLVALGGDGDAAERLGDLEVEIDFLVRLSEGDLVDVDVDAGVVVHLAEVDAPGELRFALLRLLSVG